MEAIMEKFNYRKNIRKFCDLYSVGTLFINKEPPTETGIKYNIKVALEDDEYTWTTEVNFHALNKLNEFALKRLYQLLGDFFAQNPTSSKCETVI